MADWILLKLDPPYVYQGNGVFAPKYEVVEIRHGTDPEGAEPEVVPVSRLIKSDLDPEDLWWRPVL